jgi:DHA2 family multidrug resistance protein
MLSQRFGRKNILMFSIAMFTLASMLCGLARNLPLMVLFRVLQGIGGGALITIPQAILRETFPAEEQGMAMGLYGMGVVLAPALGPTLGGWLTDNYSWPWIFYINVPVGILNLMLVSRFIHDPPYLQRAKNRIDWEGLGLLTVGLGALQLMLEQGERREWFDSSYILAMCGIAIVGLILFIWRELKAEHPAVELQVLKDPSFTSATMLGGILGMGLMGSLFLLPLFLQQLLGYTAMTSGVALMPRSLAMAVVMPIGGRFYNRFGPKVFVGAGLAVSAASFYQLSHLTAQIGFWNIFWPQLWQGVGFSLIFLALSTAALANVPHPLMTQASGLYNVVRQIFGSVGIAIAASQLTRGVARYHATLLQDVGSSDPSALSFIRSVTAGMVRSGADQITARMRALRLLDLSILREASVAAYNHVFALVTVLFLLAVPFVFFLRSARGGAPAEVMVE